MKIEYDSEAKAAYIEIDQSATIKATIEITPTLFVDVDEYGVVTGVELLRPSEPVSVDSISQKALVREAQVDQLARSLRTVAMMTLQQNQLTSRSTVHIRHDDRNLEFQ